MRRIWTTTLFSVLLAGSIGAGGGALLFLTNAKRAFAEVDPIMIVAKTERKLWLQGYRDISCDYDGIRHNFLSDMPSYHVVKCTADGNKEVMYWFNKDQAKYTPPLFLPEHDV